MISPLDPPDEVERLARLRRLGVLGTPPEPRFDRVTRIAAQLFAVPIVLVSLVDADRQWFKSRIGLQATETPRHVSFCAHGIHTDGPLLVPDAAADERFADNPLVTGPPHIRFYLGRPLLSDRGSGVGALCVVDRVPRDPAHLDLVALEDLAAIVSEELTRPPRGALTLCSFCEGIRAADDRWLEPRDYLERVHGRFSHGICPGCYSRHVQPNLDQLDS